MTATTTNVSPRVIIIGGGFGGLACAKRLAGTGIQVTLLDRRNHNLFQPLLYQVATAALSPADIAEPIRKTLGRHKNISVVLGDVAGVDPARKAVVTDQGQQFSYDKLVIATGSEYNYFGNDNWKKVAPGLKTLEQARAIRQRLLLALEHAEIATADKRQALLTNVVIGGGPTGVEMAGAIAELGATASRDFRNIEPGHFRVLLLEAGPRILGAFPEELSTYAHGALEKLGVEVLTNTRVQDISDGEVHFAGKTVRAGAIIWGAGVKAAPAGEWLNAPADRSGRLAVNERLQVEGHPDVYAIGDVAAAHAADGTLLPALAQVAKQQGAYLGAALINLLLRGETSPPFRFRNRGNTAVIGRHAAVFDFGRWRLKGRSAWFLWALVHVYLLINFEKRLLVSVQWVWRYLTKGRGARIISEAQKDQVTLAKGAAPDESLLFSPQKSRSALMNRFEATSSEELTELRHQSAVHLADAVVRELTRCALDERRRDVEGIRAALAEAIGSAPLHHPKADILREFAIEEVERVLELETNRSSELRGWTLDSPPAVEETKP